MRKITRTFNIHVARSHVWKALVDPKILAAWGAGPAAMSARKGAKFSLWGGDIIGRNLEVVKEKKLVQEWQEKNWKVPSKVTITLKLVRLGTQVRVVHQDVPAKEFEALRKGWKDSYFQPLKQFLEEQFDFPEFDHHQGG